MSIGVTGRASWGRHALDVILSKLSWGRHDRASGLQGDVPCERAVIFAAAVRALALAAPEVGRELALAAAGSRELTLVAPEVGREVSFSSTTREVLFPDECNC